MLQALSRQRICSDLTQITHDAQNSSAMDHIDYASKIKPLDGCRFGVIRQATGTTCELLIALFINF
jgi:hypothetical protein